MIFSEGARAYETLGAFTGLAGADIYDKMQGSPRPLRVIAGGLAGYGAGHIVGKWLTKKRAKRKNKRTQRRA